MPEDIPVSKEALARRHVIDLLTYNADENGDVFVTWIEQSNLFLFHLWRHDAEAPAMFFQRNALLEISRLAPALNIRVIVPFALEDFPETDEFSVQPLADVVKLKMNSVAVQT